MKKLTGSDILLRALGLFLIVAVVLKGHELLMVAVANKEFWASWPFLIFLSSPGSMQASLRKEVSTIRIRTYLWRGIPNAIGCPYGQRDEHIDAHQKGI